MFSNRMTLMFKSLSESTSKKFVLCIKPLSNQNHIVCLCGRGSSTCSFLLNFKNLWACPVKWFRDRMAARPFTATSSKAPSSHQDQTTSHKLTNQHTLTSIRQVLQFRFVLLITPRFFSHCGKFPEKDQHHFSHHLSFFAFFFPRVFSFIPLSFFSLGSFP